MILQQTSSLMQNLKRQNRAISTRLLPSTIKTLFDRKITASLLGVFWLAGVTAASANFEDALTRELTVTTASGKTTLLPVDIPDVSAPEPIITEVLQAARQRLALEVTSGQATPSELAKGYGNMGALYHAHHIYVSAEPCYRNAQILDPKAFEWPYYLGYLYEQTDELHQAVTSFERALEIRPGYHPGQLRLAQLYIDLNDYSAAERLLRQMVELDEFRAASLFYLGQIALARQDYETTIQLLESALRERPQASRIHYPLAMAYRALGDFERAKTHLAQYGDVRPEVKDPQLDKLKALIVGARPHVHRAIDAVKVRDYHAAIEAFNKALEYDPEDANVRVSLARSLYLTGDREAALRQLHEALRLDPNHDLAHYLLGISLEHQGNYPAAVAHYRAALKANPEQGGALHYLGNASMREGHYTAAAQYYEGAIVQFPNNMPARLMEALALYRAGAPHEQVVQRLEVALAKKPNHIAIASVLARFLAASPDDDVRNGARALSLAEKSMTPFPMPEAAETLAMAYAEVDRYDDAINLQNHAIVAAFMTARADLVPHLEKTLALYKEHKPCRRPLTATDPIFIPVAPDPVGSFKDYPAGKAR